MEQCLGIKGCGIVMSWSNGESRGIETMPINGPLKGLGIGESVTFGS